MRLSYKTYLFISRKFISLTVEFSNSIISITILKKRTVLTTLPYQGKYNLRSTPSQITRTHKLHHWYSKAQNQVINSQWYFPYTQQPQQWKVQPRKSIDLELLKRHKWHKHFESIWIQIKQEAGQPVYSAPTTHYCCFIYGFSLFSISRWQQVCLPWCWWKTVPFIARLHWPASTSSHCMSPNFYCSRWQWLYNTKQSLES